MRGGNGTITASPREALERLYEEEWGLFVEKARRSLPLHDAEDAVQETASKAALALHTLEDPDQLRAWFSRILWNECTNRAKRLAWESERRVELPETSAEGSGEEEAGEGPALAVRESAAGYGEDFSVLLRREVEALPPALRGVVEAVGYGGLSFREFARESGIPHQTLADRFERARRTLRPRLSRLMRGMER